MNGPPVRAWRLYPGTRRVPAAAAPDLRARSYQITATLVTDGPARTEGVLISQGDGLAGQSLYVQGGRMIHVYRHVGRAWTTRSAPWHPPAGFAQVRLVVDRCGTGGAVTLEANGVVIGRGRIDRLARTRLGHTGIDVGCDRGQPVGVYAAPFAFGGTIRRIDVEVADDQELDVVTERRIEHALG